MLAVGTTDVCADDVGSGGKAKWPSCPGLPEGVGTPAEVEGAVLPGKEVELNGFRPKCGLVKEFGCWACVVAMFQGKVRCGFITFDVCNVFDQGEG